MKKKIFKLLSLDEGGVSGHGLMGVFFSLLSFVSYPKATYIHNCKITHHPQLKDYHHKYFGVLLKERFLKNIPEILIIY